MTELVCAENSSTPSTAVNGDHDNSVADESSVPLTSVETSMETDNIRRSLSTTSNMSNMTSSKMNIPSAVPVSAAAAAAALLATHSLSSFRQLAELWHPHVYNSAAKKPTPFSIEDILKESNRADTNNSNRLDLYGTGINNVFNHLNSQTFPYGINDSNTSVGFLPELTNALAQHMVASSVQLHKSLNQPDSSEENDNNSMSPM